MSLHQYPYSLRFFRADVPRCPHCDKAIDEPSTAAPWVCAEGVHELTCEHCGKDFRVRTDAQYFFTTLEN